MDILDNDTGEARESTAQIGPQLVRIFQDARQAALGAVPNPIPLCENQTSGSSGLTWDARGFDSIEVGTQLAGGSQSGNQPVQGSTIQGNIRRPGQSYFLFGLRANGERKWIASTHVGVSNCTPGPFPQIGLGGLGNSASFQFGPLAPGQLGTIYGFNLAQFQEAAARVPLPTELGGTRVSIAGQAAQLVYASLAQVNFVVPDSVPTGTHKISVGDSTGEVIIVPASPGLFTTAVLGGISPLGSVVTISEAGEQSSKPLVSCSVGGLCRAEPITLSDDVREVILVLYGTGMRASSLNRSCSIANVPAEILYLGPQGEFPGLDQINVRVPNLLRGVGSALLEVAVDGRKSNAVRLTLQ
ncbi:MAG: hypothetical protein ABI972_07335 [Acidobacteriota bacterium]